MAVCYNKLWKILIDRDMSKTPNKALLAKRILLCSLFAGKETG